MEAERFGRLVEVMARMAGGDRAAPFTLYAEFGRTIAAVLRRQLRDIGVEQVDADDLEGLVIEACLELAACAPSWDPEGGALPWNWAQRRLRALASAYVGIHADQFDAERHEGAASMSGGEQLQTLGPEPEELEVLTALAATDDTVHLLADALALVATPRNRAIVLAVKVQAGLGDPSPALTVARIHGLRADAVRQIVKRTLDRLRSLARTESQYAPLVELALLA